QKIECKGSRLDQVLVRQAPTSPAVARRVRLPAGFHCGAEGVTPRRPPLPDRMRGSILGVSPRREPVPDEQNREDERHGDADVARHAKSGLIEIVWVEASPDRLQR